MNPEFKEASEFYSGRISFKEREIKRLRDYAAELENSEKMLAAEYAGQIAEKDRQVKRLAELLRGRESFNAGVLAQLNEKVKAQKGYMERLSSSLGNKEKLSNDAIEKLAGQVMEKNAEMEKLRAALLAHGRVKRKLDKQASEDGIALLYGKKAENGKELDRLRSYILELENSEKMLAAEYAGQIAEKDRQVKRLVNLLRLKDDSNRMLSEKLDRKMRTEREYVERIKNAISRKEEFNQDVIKNLTLGLSKKNMEVEGLRDMAAKQDALIKRLESDVIEYRKRQDKLEAFLYEKDSITHNLEKNFAQQLKIRDYEIERLKGDLAKPFEGKSAAKSQEEIAGLRIKLSAKDEELAELVRKVSDFSEKNSILMKRLEERQKLFVESENAYNRLINSMQIQQEKRVKDLMHVNSQREVGLRTELERLKAGQRENETILAEKESRIDETLLRFSETARKLLELKGAEVPGEAAGASAGELKDKETEIFKLMKEAEERVNDAVRKEKEVARKEELLIKEQEAINAELSILKNAGVEVQKGKEYLKEKIRQYEVPEPNEPLGQPAFVGSVSEIEAAGEPGEIQPEKSVNEAVEEPAAENSAKDNVLEILRRSGKQEIVKEAVTPLRIKEKAGDDFKPVFRQAKSRVKQLQKPPALSINSKAERPKIREALVRQAENKEAFPEVDGYGEVHEISSIIDIGMQHGDSAEQIRSSLESSGYSKNNIEKAFRQVKKA